jgi:hypothetical protein
MNSEGKSKKVRRVKFEGESEGSYKCRKSKSNLKV